MLLLAAKASAFTKFHFYRRHVRQVIKIRVKLYFSNVYKKKSLRNLLGVSIYVCVSVVCVCVLRCGGGGGGGES